MATESSVTLQVLQNFSDAAFLQEEWRRLFEISPTASPPLRWEWLRDWWRVYGSTYGIGEEGLRLLTVRRGRRLIGGLPLYLAYEGPSMLRYRCLRFISTGEAELEETCPDYLDLLYEPEEKQACLQAVGSFLANSQNREWDKLDLVDLSSNSPMLALQGMLANTFEVEVLPRGACLIADLSGGFEAYLQKLPSRGRQKARRYLREAERAGAVLELASTGDQPEEFFGQLVGLHQKRWNSLGKPGCFAASRFSEFHRNLAMAGAPAGHAVIARISVEGETIAVLYGFIVNSKFYFYQSGINTVENIPIESPGKAANLMLMRFLAGRGIDKYDFLRGSSTYKDNLTTDEANLVRFRAVRRTGRRHLHRTAMFIRKGAAKVRRLFGGILN